MTTDVALHHENGAALALPTVTGGDLPGLAILEQWSNANDHATRLVAQWIFTDHVPVHHWPLPKGLTLASFPNPRMYGPDETDEQYQRRCQIAAASAAGTVLRGIPLGLPPNIALEQMGSIRGTITMKTRLKHALARNHGIKTWSVSESDEEVVVAGVDRITGDTVEIGITMAQAKTAGWTSNAAYAKTPRDMLWARAMSRLLDRIAGDILFGLASFEDVVDAPDDRPAPTVTATVARPKAEPGAGSAALRQLVADTTVAREAAVEVTKAAEPGAFPPVAEEPAPVPPVEETPPAPPADAAGNVTRPQLSQISMLLGGRHGLGGPGSVAKRGRILSALVGRPLKTTQELTADEAGQVIGYLENTDTPALLAMADAPPAAGEQEPAGTGSDPWDEPDRDASAGDQ